MKLEVTFSLVVNVLVLKTKKKTDFLVSEYNCYCTTTGFTSGTRFLLFILG